MSRSFFPLGESGDFPADPEAIGDYAGELAATGALILDQVAALKALARGDCWVADTADAFREQAQELAKRIEKASDRYVTVGKRLTTLADDLAEDEERAGARADEAAELRSMVAANPVVLPEPPPDGGMSVMPPGGEAQNNRRRQAEQRIDELQAQFDSLVRQSQVAAAAAALDIRGAIEDSVKDNWWERNAFDIGRARDALGWAAAIVGVGLAIALAVVTAPGWLVVGLIALGVILAGAALYLSWNLMTQADGSKADVVWDVIGLLSFGVGGTAARFASKVFPAVQSAVAAVRSSRAGAAVFQAVPADLLDELGRLAAVTVDTTGDALAARQLLDELATRGLAAADAARAGTLAPFPVTLAQGIVDGGRGSSQIVRQGREMLLDLRTMPGRAVDPALIQRVQRLVVTSTTAVVAANVGAVAEVLQAVTDPPGLRNGGPVRILTDIVTRLR